MYGLCMGFGVHTALLAFIHFSSGLNHAGGLVKVLAEKLSFLYPAIKLLNSYFQFPLCFV